MSGTIPVADGDDEILALVAEFKAREQAIVAIEAEQDKHGNSSDEWQRHMTEIQAIVDGSWTIRNRLAELPAQTEEGLKAKAWLAIWELCDGDIDAEPEEGNSRVAWSLARDILGRAGA